MKFVLFSLFSTLENVAQIMMMLTLFRIKIKENMIHIILGAFTLAELSFYIREYNPSPLSDLFPFIQLIITILIMRFAIKIGSLWSIFVGLVGGFGYTLLQYLMSLAYQSLGFFSMTDALKDIRLGYILQVTSSVAAIAITSILIATRFGFTFVPYSEDSRISLKNKVNLSLFLLSAACLPIFGLVYYFSFKNNGIINFSAFILAICLILFIFVSYRKEYDNDSQAVRKNRFINKECKSTTHR